MLFKLLYLRIYENFSFEIGFVELYWSLLLLVEYVDWAQSNNIYNRFITLCQYCVHLISDQLIYKVLSSTWWCHAMEKFSELLCLCEQKQPVTGEFPSQRISNVELWCFLWCWHEQAVEQTLEFPVIWEAMVYTHPKNYAQGLSCVMSCCNQASSDFTQIF